MNLKLTLLTLLLTANSCSAWEISVTGYDFTKDQQEEKDLVVVVNKDAPRWGTFKTLLAGAVLGGAFGALNYLTDELFFPLNWFVLSGTRCCMARSMVDNKKEQELIANTAWLSDWAAYYLTYNEMLGKSPFSR